MSESIMKHAWPNILCLFFTSAMTPEFNNEDVLVVIKNTIQIADVVNSGHYNLRVNTQPINVPKKSLPHLLEFLLMENSDEKECL